MWLVLILFATFLLLSASQRPRNFPPGPRCLPLLGNLVALALQLRWSSHHVVLGRWARRYGDVYGLVLGAVRVVVISGKDRIREVSNRDVLAGRPGGTYYLIRSLGKKLGIVFNEGPSWKYTRQLTLKCLKTFGYGTSRMEAAVLAESAAVLQVLDARAGSAVQVNDLFDVATLNVMWQLVAGQRYEHGDPHALNLCAKMKRAFKVVDLSGGVLTFLPWLRHVAPGLTGYRELLDLHQEIHEFISSTIDAHRISLDPTSPRDIIDVLLAEMIEQNHDELTKENLQVICLDLMEGSMETVSSTCAFMLLYILLHPPVQLKVQEEIDAVIGDDSPALVHRTKMVYTEAVILEALRMSSVGPSAVPHMALEDTKLGNYVIPKGTHVILSIHDLHYSTVWSQPHSFRPERFVTPDGTLMHDEKHMSFGNGRRRCIGENLARCELFLFLTHILQKFYIHLRDGDPTPSTEPVNGFSLSPQPFRAVFERRVKNLRLNKNI